MERETEREGKRRRRIQTHMWIKRGRHILVYMYMYMYITNRVKEQKKRQINSYLEPIHGNTILIKVFCIKFTEQ